MTLRHLLFANALFFSSTDGAERSDIPHTDSPNYYFGSERNRLSGRALADSYPDGTCDTQHYKCIHNPLHVIEEFNATTPYDCCKSCLAHNKCKSYSFWYADLPANTQYSVGNDPMCHLFNVDLNHESIIISAGNCVIGTKPQTQNRPNFILFYPDTVRASMMSTYGYPLKTTPNIDRFVETEGTAL